MRELEVVNRQRAPLAANRSSQRGKNFGCLHALRLPALRTRADDKRGQARIRQFFAVA